MLRLHDFSVAARHYYGISGSYYFAKVLTCPSLLARYLSHASFPSVEAKNTEG